MVDNRPGTTAPATGPSGCPRVMAIDGAVVMTLFLLDDESVPIVAPARMLLAPEVTPNAEPCRAMAAASGHLCRLAAPELSIVFCT